MKQLLECQVTPHGNFALVEADMKHGEFNKIGSGRVIRRAHEVVLEG